VLQAYDHVVFTTRIEMWRYLDFVMSSQAISNVLSAQLLHMTRYNRRISAQERLGNKAVKLLVAVLNNYA